MSSSGAALKEEPLIDVTDNHQNNPNPLHAQQTVSVPSSSECPVDFDLTWKILHGMQMQPSLEPENTVSLQPTLATSAQFAADSGTLSSNTDATHVDLLDASTSRTNDAPQVAYGYDTDWEERTRPTETGFMRYLIFIAEGCGCAFLWLYVVCPCTSTLFFFFLM